MALHLNQLKPHLTQDNLYKVWVKISRKEGLNTSLKQTLNISFDSRCLVPSLGQNFERNDPLLEQTEIAFDHWNTLSLILIW